MTERPKLRAALAAAALMWGASARAATLQTVEAPPEPDHAHVDLHPRVGFDEAYDSNIFLLPQGAGSWIETLRAGLSAPLALGDRHRLSLDYEGAYRNYSHSKEGSLKNAFIQEADARYWYTGEGGARLRARENYLNTIDPANAEQTGLRRRWTNTARLEAAYEPEERALWLSADAQQIRNKYVADPVLRPLLDRYEHLLGVKAGWQVQPKTVAYAAYHRQIIHFTDHPDPSRDSKGHMVDFGVEGALAAKVSGRVQVGVVARRYDAAAAPGQDTATTNVTALTSVAWEPLDRSKAELTFNRSLEESGYDVNQYYIASALTLALSHQFLWGLTARVNGLLEHDKYPTTTQVGADFVNRRDDNDQAGASLEYPLRPWLRAGASYIYRARFSRGLNDLFGYRDHVTTLSLTATY